MNFESVLGKRGWDRFWAPALLASVLIQLALACLFGHRYDMPIFMAAGYLVGTGKNPYIPMDLSAALKSPVFRGLTSIGYPPPWALLMGAVYLGSFGPTRNLSLYNLAIKIPVIASNISLALFTRKILREKNIKDEKVRTAWLFFLLNPFLLFTTAAWGQFDSAVALATIAALHLLGSKRLDISAFILALALSMKPTPLPLLPVCVLFLAKNGPGPAIRWLFVFFASLILLCAGPFFVFRWSPAPIIHGWNAHLSFTGALSLGSFVELFQRSYAMSGNPWIFGLIWVPALAAVLLLFPIEGTKFEDLLSAGTRATLAVFLTRSWLSEPNIVLLLSLSAILVSTGRMDKRLFDGLWVSPMIFSIFNFSPPQLLYLHFPRALEKSFTLDARVHTVRLIAKSASVVPWQIYGWRALFRRGGAEADDAGP